MIKPLHFWQTSTSVVTRAELVAFESRYDVRLPAALIEFCTRWSGGYPDEQNRMYLVPAAFPAYHKEYGDPRISVDGLFGMTKTPSDCDLEKQYLSWGDEFTISLLPISFDLMGNFVVMRTDSPDGPVFWRDHELWEAPGRPYLIPVAENLESFYNALTRDPGDDGD